MSMKRYDPQAPVVNWFIISKNYRGIAHKAELLDLCSPVWVKSFLLRLDGFWLRNRDQKRRDGILESW